MFAGRSQSWLFAFGVAAVLAVSLALDVTPRYALGDSASYLSTRLWDQLPDDRSWTYGLLISKAVRMTRRLSVIPVSQVLLGWACACVFARALTGFCGVAAGWGVLVVAVLVLNPLDFYWARAVMSDTPAMGAFLLLVSVLLWRPRLAFLLPAVFVLSFILAGLRIVYLPPLVLGFAATALVWGWQIRGAQGEQRRAVRDVALRHAALTVVVLAAYGGFAVWNARMLHRPDISANHAAQRFLVSAWSPVMAGPAQALDLPPAEKAALVPFTYDARLAQAFAPTGLGETLARRYGGYRNAGPAYDKLIRAAVLDDPEAFARLIVHSWSDYLNPALVLQYHHERRLSGTTTYKAPNALEPGLLDMLRGWGVRSTLAPELPQVLSNGLEYYAGAGAYWALLLALYATLALVVLGSLPDEAMSPELSVLTVFAFASIGLIAFTSNELVTRYLMPLAVPLIVTAAVGCVVQSRAMSYRMKPRLTATLS
jgi:hypothetical protein